MKLYQDKLKYNIYFVIINDFKFLFYIQMSQIERKYLRILIYKILHILAL